MEDRPAATGEPATKPQQKEALLVELQAVEAALVLETVPAQWAELSQYAALTLQTRTAPHQTGQMPLMGAGEMDPASLCEQRPKFEFPLELLHRLIQFV